jgi:hypothetical protein
MHIMNTCDMMLMFRFIHLPQPAEFQNLETPLQDVNGQNCYRVLLYIDGFIVKIQRPDYAGDAYFCGRHGKSCDSLNVQYITDKTGKPTMIAATFRPIYRPIVT